MTARTLMVQGTGSNVGKSILVAALCRAFAREGLRVAPFKAQNMSNNAHVCADGGEIGRAQAVQARAARVEPSVLMNPVLLKPTTDIGSQVIVRGRAIGTMTAREYRDYKPNLVPVVKECLDELRAAHDLVILEGAGSPAEINLRGDDIVNMAAAAMCDAPVLLVGDIDFGGVFAQLIGTMHLLLPEESARVRGFIINKFRGDPAILQPGLDYLEDKAGIPVLGVVPWFRGIRIAEEDAIPKRARGGAAVAGAPVTGDAEKRKIRIEVIRHPRISNFTDFDALEAEEDVALSYVESTEGPFSNGEPVADGEPLPDIIILPGTKSTIADLGALRAAGFDRRIASALDSGAEVVGICGGYQMLGEHILDPEGVESAETSSPGLGHLPVLTSFHGEKETAQVTAVHLESGVEVSGYEIHSGRSKGRAGAFPVFRVTRRRGVAIEEADGASARGGRVWGTYIHGLFDTPRFRRDLIDRARLRRGMGRGTGAVIVDADDELDKLADHVAGAIDMEKIRRIMKGTGV